VANTLTNVIPVLSQAAQVVSRESCGMLRAVDLRGNAEPVALGQTLDIPKAPVSTTASWSESLMPSLTDRTITGLQLSLSTAKKVDWHITGEQQRAMDSGGSTAMDDFRRQAEQAMRALANEIEAYTWGLGYKAASRAVGTAGTTPFASNLIAASTVAGILNKNGAPMSGRSLVLDPAAYANVQGQFANVATTRSDASFEAGEIPAISGLIPRLGTQITTHTKGTNSGATVNNAGYAIGATTLTLSSAGTGTILSGDVVAFASENAGINYVVGTGDADVSGGGTIVLNDPGLLLAMSTATKAITTGNSYVPNLALSRDAIILVVRPPAQPEGSRYMEHTTVVDPVSGIPFGVCKIVGDSVVHYSVRCIYGAIVVEEGHIATLMG
jgi:hypothetical protein